MKGVELAIESVKKSNLKIGLASSSPLSLIHAVLEKTGLQNEFTVVCSAEHLPFGKPHLLTAHWHSIASLLNVSALKILSMV